MLGAIGNRRKQRPSEWEVEDNRVTSSAGGTKKDARVALQQHFRASKQLFNINTHVLFQK